MTDTADQNSPHFDQSASDDEKGRDSVDDDEEVPHPQETSAAESLVGDIYSCSPHEDVDLPSRDDDCLRVANVAVFARQASIVLLGPHLPTHDSETPKTPQRQKSQSEIERNTVLSTSGIPALEEATRRQQLLERATRTSRNIEAAENLESGSLQRSSSAETDLMSNDKKIMDRAHPQWQSANLERDRLSHIKGEAGENEPKSTTDNLSLAARAPLVRGGSQFISLRHHVRNGTASFPVVFLEGEVDSSDSSRSEYSKQIDISNNERAADAVEWQRSPVGIARMAEIAAVTIATAPNRAIRTNKYLKLFAPTHSAHATFTVLATLHKRMNGQGWQRRGGWDSYLVRKSQAELDEGRVYGVKSKDGCVELLMLSSNNVCGRIPAIIARLASLKCINFADNHIRGPIPAELGLLLQLQTLQLQGNNLRDEISPLLGSLISLIRLSLGNNKLTGPLPDSLGNLVHLQFLSVENNRLSGAIPPLLCRLAALETFNASTNKLNGQIPLEIGSLGLLKKLDLGHNLLTGEIPPSICCLRSLVWLRLNDNQLTGPVPIHLSNLRNLLILNIGGNRLSGPVPPGIGKMEDLVSVNLHGNLFERPFPYPPSFDRASRIGGLRSLDLGQNELEAPFPELKGLPQLLTLSLEDNRMHGPLRGDLASTCGNLLKLYLQHNRLTGEIPPALGELSKLEILDISGNCFEGGLPRELGSLELLQSFSASDNQLGGNLPAFLGKLSMLTTLALDGNSFSGEVPPELGMLSGLKRLYLERNELVGSIPSELSKCLQLEALYLHQNKLQGRIPESLRQLVNLRYLYLYKNCLVGTVPEWLGVLPRLLGLVLGENKLRGYIPWQLGHLHELQDLYLNDNCLEGSIPERLGHCERLQRLHLGGNRLTGRIPRYLRHVRDLRELNIERNNLHGEVPIPLFLKASLGSNARGFQFGGNPRLVDSREQFAETVAELQLVEPAGPNISLEEDKNAPPGSSASHRLQPFTPQQAGNSSTANGSGDGNRGGGGEGAGEAFRDGRARDSREELEGGAVMILADPRVYEAERDKGGGRAVSSPDGSRDRIGYSRPWETSEDVSYFLLKVVAGNSLALLDFFFAARLYDAGCEWGARAILVWKGIASLAGVAATRRLGYGLKWQTLAAVQFAMPMQARICFIHSCESGLFQALQQVEWYWHAMLQLVTQLAAVLACLDGGPAGYAVWLPLTIKSLVVGVVCMQRLDDRRMFLIGQRDGATTSIVAAKFILFFRGSAFARIFMVGHHMAELWARAIPLAAMATAFAERGPPAFCVLYTVVAMLPGMVMRRVVRSRRERMVAGRRTGTCAVRAVVERVLAMSLALDSEFGLGTPSHVLAAIVTTLEFPAFTALAGYFARPYPTAMAEALMTVCTLMLIYTWAVSVMEIMVTLGLAPPSPSPRLSFFSSRTPSVFSGSLPPLSGRSRLLSSQRLPESNATLDLTSRNAALNERSTKYEAGEFDVVRGGGYGSRSGMGKGGADGSSAGAVIPIEL